MTAAADYSFNKSHAACYALISYRTAYLKANYPAEYMAAVISSVMSTKDKVPFFVNRCNEMGIDVLPPDVNDVRPRLRRLRQLDPVRARRGEERRPPGGGGDHRRPRARRAVRVDLGLLRPGRRAGRQQARDRVPGQVRRPRLDRRQPHGDARGAAAGPGVAARRHRTTRCAARARSSTSAATARREDAPAGAFSAQRPPVPAEEFGQRELLTLEKETLGTFLSSHPLTEVREALRERGGLLARGRGRQAGRGLDHGRRDRGGGEEGPNPHAAAT